MAFLNYALDDSDWKMKLQGELPNNVKNGLLTKAAYNHLNIIIKLRLCF